MVEVEHVKAHRTKREKKEMSHFEHFVTVEERKDCGDLKPKSSQILIHNSASSTLGLVHSLSPLRSPSIIPLLRL